MIFLKTQMERMEAALKWFIFLSFFIKLNFPVLACPSLSNWETRSRIYCRENPLWYHCLRGATGVEMEACVKPRFIEEGVYPVLSRDLKTLIPIRCPASLYQPYGQMSNEFKKITCSFFKSSCDGIGEETCSEGSQTEDRTCRCNYTQGYRPLKYLFSNPSNISCLQPKIDGLECVFLPCSEDEELTSAYMCVEKNERIKKEVTHEIKMITNLSSSEITSFTGVTKLSSTSRLNEATEGIIFGMPSTVYKEKKFKLFQLHQYQQIDRERETMDSSLIWLILTTSFGKECKPKVPSWKVTKKDIYSRVTSKDSRVCSNPMATSSSWAQDVIPCDLCDRPKQKFCNRCQVSLCEKCVSRHKNEFNFMSHDIVSLAKRNIELTFPECLTHSGEKCNAHCRKCNKPVCEVCDKLGLHAGHHVRKTTEIVQQKKKNLEMETKKMETSIKDYQGIANDFCKRMSLVELTFDELEQNKEMQRQSWHQEVDDMFDKLGCQMQFLRNMKISYLAQQQMDINTVISDMLEIVQENKHILQSRNASTVLDYRSKWKGNGEFPKPIDVEIPNFKAHTNHGQESVIEFDGFRATLTQVSQSRQMDNVNFFSTRQLLNEVQEITSFLTEQKPLFRVECVGENEAWVSGIANTITRVHLQKSKVDRIESTCHEWPADITMSRNGELMYCDNEEGTVNIVIDGVIKTIITTPQDWKPNGVCCFQFGNILVNISVGKNNKIVLYNGPNIMHEFERDELGYPIFKEGNYSLKMTENNNGDICVSDGNANVVVVLDGAGRVRFRYDGTNRQNNFGPKDIVTDCLSQIIVTDYNNDCLHILNYKGKLLRYIDNRGLSRPCGLSVDSKERLWVALCHSGELKVLEYLT